MILSIPIGAVCGLIFLLPILFTLPDIAMLLAGKAFSHINLSFVKPSKNPVANLLVWCLNSLWDRKPEDLEWQVLYAFSVLDSDAINLVVRRSLPAWHTYWYVIVFLSAVFCCISICCAASHATWSSARDRALPFSSTFSGLNKYLGGVPFNAYLLSTVIQLLVGLLSLGSTAALNAFVGVAVLCLNTGYVLPVVVLANGRKDILHGKDHRGSHECMHSCLGAISDCSVLDAGGCSSNTRFNELSVPLTVLDSCWLNQVDYTSVVYVGFATISVVWYMMGKQCLTNPRDLGWQLADGRFHSAGPRGMRMSNDQTLLGGILYNRLFNT